MSIDIKRRSASLLEYALLVVGVALGSLVAVTAFGSEVVDTYGTAAGRLSRAGRSARGIGTETAPLLSPLALDPDAVAVQEALFGVGLSDLLDDARER